MLKRLKHHIKLQIERLLGKMIYGTVIFLIVGFSLISIYAATHKLAYLSLLWILGLVYATTYFIDAIEFSEIVDDLDQDSLTDSIYLSKSYFNM